MSKLYCFYDKSKTPGPANHRCDICGKLMCKICGYKKDGIDYCNECWSLEQSNIHKSRIEDILSPKDMPDGYQD